MIKQKYERHYGTILHLDVNALKLLRAFKETNE